MIPLTPREEKRLVAQLKAGKDSAFNQLQALAKPWLYDLIYKTLGRFRSDADDVYQAVLESVWKCIDNFQGRSRLSTWLHRIAINQCRNQIRHNKVRKQDRATEFIAEVGKASAMGSARPDEELEAQQTLKLLNEAVHRLSEEHREIWILRTIEGLSYEEIARIEGLPIGTVRSRIHRARKEVLLFLKEHKTVDTAMES
jgi:RNA polymerase sigma-70 factor (ECF subfamily)